MSQVVSTSVHGSWRRVRRPPDTVSAGGTAAGDGPPCRTLMARPGAVARGHVVFPVAVPHRLPSIPSGPPRIQCPSDVAGHRT